MEEGSICEAHTSLLLNDSLKITICDDLSRGRVVGSKNIIEENSMMNIIYAKTYICISYTHPYVCALKF